MYSNILAIWLNKCRECGFDMYVGKWNIGCVFTMGTCISQCFNTAYIQIISQPRNESQSITWIFLPDSEPIPDTDWTCEIMTCFYYQELSMSISFTKQKSLGVNITQILFKKICQEADQTVMLQKVAGDFIFGICDRMSVSI